MDELKKEVGRVEEELSKVSSQMSTSIGLMRELSPPKRDVTSLEEVGGEVSSSSSDLAAGGIKGFHDRVRFYKSRYGGAGGI